MPTRWFLNYILIITVIFPINYIVNSSTPTVFYPCLITCLTMIFRQITVGAPVFNLHLFKTFPVTIFLAFLFIAPFFTPIVIRSAAFNVSILSVLLVLVSKTPQFTMNSYRTIWGSLITIEFFASIFQLVNGWIPIYSRLNIDSLFPVVQNWSVTRVTGTFGHPLPASTFFSVSSVLFAHLFIIKRRRSDLIIFLASTLLVLFTFSRGSIIATFVGFVFVLLQNSKINRHTFASIFSIFAAIGMAYFFRFFYDIRNNTSEGTGSFSVRKDVYNYLASSINDYILGVGGGNAQNYFQNNFSSSLIIENSTLQSVIGIGIIGTGLLMLSFVALVRKLQINAAIFGPMATFVISINSYNFFEGARWLHVLPALSIILLKIEDKNSKFVMNDFKRK